MSTRISPILIAALSTFLSIAPARAVIVKVSADTYLTNDSQYGPDKQMGSDKSMEIRTMAGTRQRIAYLMFDISGLEGSFDGATLTMTATRSNRPRPLAIHGVRDGATGGLGEVWDESRICYNNAAGFERSPSGTYAVSNELSGVLAKLEMEKRLGSYTSEPSSELTNFLARDLNGHVTLAVFLTGSDDNADYYFSAKESGEGTEAFLDLPNMHPETVVAAVAEPPAAPVVEPTPEPEPEPIVEPTPAAEPEPAVVQPVAAVEPPAPAPIVAPQPVQAVQTASDSSDLKSTLQLAITAVFLLIGVSIGLLIAMALIRRNANSQPAAQPVPQPRAPAIPNPRAQAFPQPDLHENDHGDKRKPLSRPGFRQ